MRNVVGDSDPQIHGGNRIGNRLARGVLLVGLSAVAITGCSESDGAPEHVVTTTATSVESSMPPNEEMLGTDIGTQVDEFALDIFELADMSESNPNITVETTMHSTNIGGRMVFTDAATTVVTIRTDAAYGDGFGTYSLIMEGFLGRSEHVEPTGLTNLVIAADVYRQNEQEKPWGVGGVYYFGISKQIGSDPTKWNLSYSALLQSGGVERLAYTTSHFPDIPNSQPLTSEKFEELSAQARIVLDRAIAGEPVTFAGAS